MLQEVYYIVVIGNFERDPIECESYPSPEKIVEAIKRLDGKTARIEKRYKLQQ